MVSEKFMLNSDSGRMAAARYAAETFAEAAKLGHRDTLRLNLLVEETLGMVKSMVDEFYGQLWFEGDESACEIHLEATANMNADKKQELLSVSRTGKNAAPMGFMGKLADVISGALHSFGRSIDNYGSAVMQYGVVSEGINTPYLYDFTPVWTLQQYKTGLAGAEGCGEAMDELEKSIVANLADDVVVGVRGDRIELVILKKFRA